MVLYNLFIILAAILGKPISTVAIVTIALEAIVFSIGSCHTFITNQKYADDVNDITIHLTELNNLLNNHMNKSDEDGNNVEH